MTVSWTLSKRSAEAKVSLPTYQSGKRRRMVEDLGFRYGSDASRLGFRGWPTVNRSNRQGGEGIASWCAPDLRLDICNPDGRGRRRHESGNCINRQQP